MAINHTRILQSYSGDVYDFSAQYDSYTLMLASKTDYLDVVTAENCSDIAYLKDED